MVNSPSTTAVGEERRRDDRGAQVGHAAHAAASCPTGAQAARRVDQRAHVDRADAGVDRAVRERQRQHHVERDQRVVGVEEPAGVRLDERGDAGDERDRVARRTAARSGTRRRARAFGSLRCTNSGRRQQQGQRHEDGADGQLQAEHERCAEALVRRTPWSVPLSDHLSNSVDQFEQRHRHVLQREPCHRQQRAMKKIAADDQDDVGAEPAEPTATADGAAWGCRRRYRDGAGVEVPATTLPSFCSLSQHPVASPSPRP